jgi:hypothetical protein
MNTAANTSNLINISDMSDAELAALLGMGNDDETECTPCSDHYVYTITGCTYYLRNEFKSMGGIWNPSEKSWTVKGRLLDATVWGWRRQGCKVEISDCYCWAE